MRVMQTYDYEDMRSLIRDWGVVWIRNSNGEFQLFSGSGQVTLPILRVENLSICEEYTKENKNFAYKFSYPNITIWDKSVEQFEDVSAPAFQKVSICGMGIYAYNKYSESITRPVPTFKMREAVESILCDLLDFKHRK